MATAITATSGSVKKVVKRRKRKKKTKNYYFHQGTEKAIIRYNKTDDARLKNVLLHHNAIRKGLKKKVYKKDDLKKDLLKIAPEILFPISGINYSDKMLIFLIFCIN